MTEQEQDLEWLRGLKPRLWTQKHDPRRGPWMSANYERLTDDELTRLFEIVLKHGLPVGMCNTEFGFGCGIAIHEPEKPALFPGVEEETQPDLLVIVSRQHLPLSQSTFEAKDRLTFDDGWRVFSELTHRDQNVELLKRCGLPEPAPKSAYEY